MQTRGTFIQILSAFLGLSLSVLSCEKHEIVEDIIEVPAYPDLEGLKADTLSTVSASLSFYGAYSQTVDRWYLDLYSENGVTYDLSTDTYSGKGKIIRLCLHTKISDGEVKDIPVITGHYTTPESYSDLSVGQFETGYDRTFDHPYLGSLRATYGSCYIDLESKEYRPLAFMDGFFDIKKSDNGYSVAGMLVDEAFEKHYFKYEGHIDSVSEYFFPGVDDTVLEKDVTLTKAELPKLEIRDRGDQYKYNGSFRNYRVFLTSEGVEVSQTSQIWDNIKLSGHGPVMLLDLFVSPDADGSIPEGEYTLTPRLENNGLDGSDIVPFRFVAGYPRRYSSPQGCWYFNLADNGLWTGEYAMVVGGKLNVSYDFNGAPILSGKLSDGTHIITLDWK